MSKLTEKLNELKVCESLVYEIESGQSKTYQEIYQNAHKYAQSFSDLDQAVISVIIPNSIDYLEIMIGVIISGNIFNPIPYFVENAELPRVLGYVNPAVVLTDRQDLISSQNPLQDKFIFKNYSSEKHSSFDSFNLNEQPDSQIAALYYSSGTTGNPKGVLYSHKNIYALIDSLCRGFQFDQKTRHLTFLPFGHTASINYNIWPCLFQKSELHISKGFEFLRATFFKELSERKINYTQIVPTVAYMVLKLGLKTDGLDLSSLRYIGCGSSTLPKEVQKEFEMKFGLKMSNLYGLSETGPSHFDNPLMPEWREGTIGYPLDVNKCKIAEDGEILLKGDNVFAGYYKNEKLYNEVVKNGWFHTGDLGEEKEGVFYFKDRKKDLIIKSGINIVPSEIEEIIYGHKSVHECVVVGKDDPVFGQKIVCCISLNDPNLDWDEQKKDIRRRCKGLLSTYKVPDQFELLANIPKTHSGKLVRKDVRNFVNR